VNTVTYSQIVQHMVAILAGLLPVKHKPSVIAWPDRPDDFTEQKLEKDHPNGCYAVRYLKSTASETGHETALFGVVLVANSFTRVGNMAATVKIAMQDTVSPLGQKYTFAGIEPIEHLAGWMRDTVIFAVPRSKQTITDKAAVIAALNL
jgi:hypothetical protein